LWANAEDLPRISALIADESPPAPIAAAMPELVSALIQ
jgi:hypothetical protein